MKRKDKELEQLMKRLPSVEDRQSKEDLYQKISARVNKQKRKKAPWVLPGLATMAVVLVLAVFIPVFLNDNQLLTVDESSKDTHENKEFSTSSSEDHSSDQTFQSKEADRAEIEEAKPHRSKQKEEQPAIEGNEEETEEQESGSAPLANDSELDSMITMSSNNGFEIMAYPGRNAEVVLPLSINKEASKIDLDKYGLADRMTTSLQYEINEQKAEAVVIFPNDFQVNGSASTQTIVESIRWELENVAPQLERILIRKENGNPVVLGNYGEMTELPVIEQGEYIFMLYQFEDLSERLLVPIAIDTPLTFQEALKNMKEKGNGLFVKPPVPEHVQFTTIQSKEGLVTIELHHKSWASEQQVLTMIEAILATGAQFGFKEIQFKGLNVSEFSTYNLKEPIPVPERINPIVEE
ncbi:hypothetical protein SAMN05192559_104313 [Halobacillus karajensis]|uniref:Sigma-X negative effector n=1 Tax=Halobacillus karajensis TaxID=195088 RepID=A0A024P2T5_9BACI|nr:hypothetical protein [Halobacillus karajensis]CDQ19460.1 Sigma-X negative effector [Halobacillus karajensis]CDQ21922.1 Sigma-X negative effector [Halobacillus karajensis]CDQ27763.1 Sigma-X negative effector [Halobacillus karajensis]SEH82096.1 hypothetical protein SAMN05192559_104313 [Halobacillus karajensis]